MAEEKYFENRIKNYLKSIGAWKVKFFANQFTPRGIPDILACVNGRFIGIEVKATRGRPSDIQLWQCEEIRKSGGLAYIVYPSGWERLKEILTLVTEGKEVPEVDIILKGD